MTPGGLDRDRFAKCQALAVGGATPGEREAGRAAAARVAANAGLTVEEAERLVGGGSQASPRRGSSSPEPETSRPSRETYAWRKPKPEPEPITVADILAQKAADLARRKKAAARRKRDDRALHAEEEKAKAVLREQQAVRDREWAEARLRRGTEPLP